MNLDFLRYLKGRPSVIPATEPLNHLASQDLARGSCYIILERQAKHSFEVFVSLIKGKCTECRHQEAFPCESIGCERCTLPCPCVGCEHARAQGLCFTMRSPLEIRMTYAIQTMPIFWISNHGPENIPLTGLEVVSDIAHRFMKQSRNPVVLLDGVEHLILVNGSFSVLRFLRDMQECTILYHAILIMPANPLAMEKKDLALFERDMKLIGEVTKRQKPYKN